MISSSSAGSVSASGLCRATSPPKAVVYSATGRDVEVVVVDGKEVVSRGELATMNEEAVWREAERRGHEVVARAGLTEKVKGRWPVM